MVSYQDIENASANIKTVDVKGKNYAEVKERIKAFRTLFPNGCISTEITHLDNGMVVMRASVADEDGKLLATGTAYEKEGSTYINKTSYIENCETSAVGRALGMLGFGINDALCSAEEVQTAIAEQDPLGKAPVCAHCGKPIYAEDFNDKHFEISDIVRTCKKFYGGTMLHPHCVSEWKESK